MNSPWGQVQHKTTLARGIHFVSTAGHGGFMIANGTMDKFHPALKLVSVFGGKWGGYTCFEEDCESMAVLFEMQEAGMSTGGFSTVTKEEVVSALNGGTRYKEYLRLRGLVTELPPIIQAAKDMGMLQIVHVTA